MIASQLKSRVPLRGLGDRGDGHAPVSPPSWSSAASSVLGVGRKSGSVLGVGLPTGRKSGSVLGVGLPTRRKSGFQSWLRVRATCEVWQGLMPGTHCPH